jgi:hypothetical protein
MNIEKMFNMFDDQYIKFENVECKQSNRPDLHAFLLLDRLFPTDNHGDMVSSASHDVICLCITSEQMDTLTVDNVLELTRCGVRYEPEFDCLTMFV